MKKLKSIAIGAFVALAGFVGVSVVTDSPLFADATVSSARDCDANAIIYCGAQSISALRSSYGANKANTQAIFTKMGISSSMVNSGKYQLGSVTKDGKVVVGGKTVATGAITVGRQYMSGSTAVKAGSTTFYMRSPSVSFRSSALQAFVFTDANGKFLGAVLLACGNPVKATPVPTPKPAPVYTCDSLKAQKISRTQYKFTTSATGKNGATIKGYRYYFGDKATAVAGAATTTHTYAKAGTYKVTAVVDFTINGKTVPVTGNCNTTITVAPNMIDVCRLSDKKYPVSIKEEDFDAKKYSKNKADCATTPAPKMIDVCRLSDKKYPVSIKESDFDASKYSKNPSDCTPVVVKNMTVCRLSDKAYPVTIKETEFDTSKYSINPEDCKTYIDVCRLEDKAYPVRIDQKEFDASKHSMSQEDCKTYIDVCRLSDNAFPVRIEEKDFDASKYSKQAADCAPAPKTIEVCRLSDMKYPVTIEEKDFDATKHSMQQEDCVPKPVMIDVCRLSDHKYPVRIDQKEFDATKYSMDQKDCVVAPVEKNIDVCRLADKTYPVSIKESDFDASKYSKDAKDCESTPVAPVEPEKPAAVIELPRTGLAGGIASVFGLGSLVAATGYYIASRRALR